MERGREDKGRVMGGGRREGDGGKDRRRERGRRVEGEEGERINHIQSCGCHGYFFAVETDGGVANSEVGHKNIVETLFNNISKEEGTVVQRVVETTQNLSETREEENTNHTTITAGLLHKSPPKFGIPIREVPLSQLRNLY